MGKSDFTCYKCGHGGYQFEFDGKRCTASVLVKQQDGRWVEQTIAGVYDGYGHIDTRPDGGKPHKVGGELTYELGEPDRTPGESDSDYMQRIDEWKMKLPKTLRFHVVEPTSHVYVRRDAAFWERRIAVVEANPDWQDFTPSSFMAFNVACDGCSEKKGYWRLPAGAESSLETFKDFRARVAKTTAHQHVEGAEQALKGAQKRVTEAQTGIASAQEALARAQQVVVQSQEGLARAQAEMAKAQDGVAEADGVLRGKRQAKDAFHEGIPLVAMIEPPRERGRDHHTGDYERCQHCRKIRRMY
jgi:hypothetical protein